MTFTLVADGTSDKVLMRIIEWCLRKSGVVTIEGRWADPDAIRTNGSDLAARLATALDLFPCDTLFVHRDAENQKPEQRPDEIAKAARTSGGKHVPVIPVRMTGARLLSSEVAIRRAAGNPNGKMKLDMPDMSQVEELPNPKARLHRLISSASRFNSMRRSSLRVDQRIHRIPEYIDDFSPLESLSAFRTLQRDIDAAVRKLPGAIR